MSADELTIRTIHDGRICVLTLRGELDVLTAGCFLDRLKQAVDDQTERLVLDLAEVTFLDCAGARALAIATCTLPPSECPVILRSLSPAARRLMDLLGLDLEQRRPVSAGLEQQTLVQLVDEPEGTPVPAEPVGRPD